MRGSDVPVENVAEIVWGLLLLVYLGGAGRPEYLQPAVLTVFAAGGCAALLELQLRRIRWRWLLLYDMAVWTVLLSAMVLLTGGRGSELWPAYILMSLTAPAVQNRRLPYALLSINCLLYAVIYTLVNPYGLPFIPSLLILRIGMIFLVAYVVDRSMARERSAQQQSLRVAQHRVGELVSTRDAERRRLAGEIHDWLGAGVVAPMRRLELAQRAPDMEGARRHIGEALETLRRSHEDLRRVMENLHPHLLEQMGLAGALEAYVHQWGFEHGIRTDFRLEPGPEPPAEAALAAYRIVQEALNNCAKHSGAASVAVRLIAAPGHLTLMVSDDGQGFATPRSGGRGLAGMSERAALFGGRVDITSRPGQGTTVTAELPIRRAE